MRRCPPWVGADIYHSRGSVAGTMTAIGQKRTPTQGRPGRYQPPSALARSDSNTKCVRLEREPFSGSIEKLATFRVESVQQVQYQGGCEAKRLERRACVSITKLGIQRLNRDWTCPLFWPRSHFVRNPDPYLDLEWIFVGSLSPKLFAGDY